MVPHGIHDTEFSAGFKMMYNGKQAADWVREKN
jgi:hypothetical protein